MRLEEVDCSEMMNKPRVDLYCISVCCVTQANLIVRFPAQKEG